MESRYGKYICKYLREIRLEIAKLNGIDYAPVECNHQDECSGHCPACDDEVKALYDKLMEKKEAGTIIKFPRYKNLCTDAGIPPEEFKVVHKPRLLRGWINQDRLVKTLIMADKEIDNDDDL